MPSTTRSGDAVSNERVVLVGSSLALSRSRSLALGREVREEEARCHREELELLEERAWKYHYCWETGEVEATGLECNGRVGAGLDGAKEDSFGDSDSSDIRYHDSDSSDRDSLGGSTSKSCADIDKNGGSTCKGSADSEGIGGNTSKFGAASDWIDGCTAGVNTSDGIPAQNNSSSEKSVNSSVSIGGANSGSSGGSTSKGGAHSDSSDSDSDSSDSDSGAGNDSTSGSTSKAVAATASDEPAEGVSSQNNSDKSDTTTATASVATTEVGIAIAFSGGSTSSHRKVSKARKRLRPVDLAPSCEYERIRARNVAERRAGLARLEAGGEGLVRLKTGVEGEVLD